MTPSTDHPLPAVPPNMPRVKPNAFTRWLGRSVLRIGGWRVVGTVPDIAKVVMIAAPHSSNWDGLWGFGVKLALGLEVRVMGKDSLLRIPVLGYLLRKMGVMPVDRKATSGVIEQAASMIRDSERLWYVIAPEGTRKRVERWKTGFWKIAKAADVPVLPVYFHYPERIVGFGPVFHLTTSMADDMARIRAWYRPWQGKHHDTT